MRKRSVGVQKDNTKKTNTTVTTCFVFRAVKVHDKDQEFQATVRHYVGFSHIVYCYSSFRIIDNKRRVRTIYEVHQKKPRDAN